MKNSKLVWSNDPRDKARIVEESSKRIPSEVSDGVIKAGAWTAVFRLEKSGRGGKTVTVIDQLPRQEKFLNELCKELKSKCGSGGTVDMSGETCLIEIQGDKRVAIKAIFDKKGIKYKGM